MARKRVKPKTPEQIAADKRRDRKNTFIALNLQPEASDLATSVDIEVRREDRKTVAGARRWDAFDALAAKNQKPDPSRKPSDLPTPTLDAASYNAARQLERDMRIARGDADKGRSSQYVDKTNLCLTDDKRLEAGSRVRAVLSRVGERDAWLLTELIYPTIPRETWRETVAYVTGETHSHAQAAVVRSACANLAAAYSRRAVAA